MSKEACQKEILCLGKAISDLKTIILFLDYKRTKSIKEFGTLDIEDVELGTKQSEYVISQCSKMVKSLMP